MPHVQANGIRLHYRFDERRDGAADAPVLVLSNSLGTTLAMWDPQIAAFTEHFRVLRYDMRGHGDSDAPDGDYSIETLGRDVVGLLDALGLQRVHFCGLSIGGLTGQWLGLHAAARLQRLIVCNTAAKIGQADGWNARIAQVRAKGMTDVAAASIGRWFTAEFVDRDPAAVDAVHRQLLSLTTPGYCGGCAAVRDADFRGALAAITVPTLVVGGRGDQVTTVADARFIAAGVADGRVAEISGAHLSNIESQAAFDAAVLRFLGVDVVQHLHEDARYAIGLARRRETLGSAHVDRSLQNVTPFNAEFQDAITRNAWGEIWTRAGLPGHTRSLLTIAMLIALGRDGELKLHLNAARHNGVTRDEIKELLMQAAIYCGVPAANHAFSLAAEIFAQQDREATQA
ncbi:bifunctional 3-oxoadipate enol-lactonase/4-carboxymuconolactone decarboxylase PcaDC [Solimonas marina]|uniref:4-carboxymuconolactone decarboxylase n=1 Tax=Solimonas marina TaxID=2714601 RepID=A0A970B5U0_9GAMM|nr:3-oxoadipate enol-lactonase [Solimonas marina]NKF23752.1 3-oxoadipate enol-lactonase [Solimonas marina]